MESAKNIVNEDNNSFTGGIHALEKNNITVNNLEMEKLYEDVQVILNHLAKFQNSTFLVDQFVRLPINTEERLYAVVNLVFDKAVNEPSFTKVCASFSRQVSGVKGIKMENGLLKESFRKTLLTICQTEFEGFISEMQNTEKHIKEIKDYNSMDQNDEKQKKLFKRNLGTVRFIGELYNSNMVPATIIYYRCMESLINPPKETFLEYLYTLLTTTGKYLEEQMAVDVRKKNLKKKFSKRNSPSLDAFFKRIISIVQNTENSKVSLRVRLMLQDLIILRQNNWVSATK